MADIRLSKRDSLVLNAIYMNSDSDPAEICEIVGITHKSFMDCMHKDIVQERLKEMTNELLVLSSFNRTKQAIERSAKSPTLLRTTFELDGSLKKSPLVSIDNSRHSTKNSINMISIRKDYEAGEPVQIPDINGQDSRPAPLALTDELPKAKDHVLFVSVGGKDTSKKGLQVPQSVDAPVLDAEYADGTELTSLSHVMPDEQGEGCLPSTHSPPVIEQGTPTQHAEIDRSCLSIINPLTTGGSAF